jgi:hypothetical protein
MKTAGLALPDSVVNAQAHLSASKVTNSQLIQMLRGVAVLSLADHQSTTQQGKKKLKDQRYNVNKDSLAIIKTRTATDLRRTVKDVTPAHGFQSSLH